MNNAHTLVIRAQEYESNGNLESSIKLLLKAVESFHQDGDLVNEIKSAHKLASLLFDSGHISESWDHYEKVLVGANLLDKPSLQADSLRWMAFLSIKSGNLQDGLRYAEEGLKVCAQYNLLENYADIFAVLGNIYFETGDFQIALLYFNKALEKAEQIVYSWREATVLGDMGDIYRLLNNDHKALHYFEKAIDVAKKAGHFKAQCSFLVSVQLV